MFEAVRNCSFVRADPTYIAFDVRGRPCVCARVGAEGDAAHTSLVMPTCRPRLTAR